ncbi:MAG: DNA polymerase/3'-5' exonuclease PolX, partial [Syntrophomonadaceae bacterium]|nr:DNA polymerase/3'-5' exonuclease PolX [Syntrophomonadaceae bacterium]
MTNREIARTLERIADILQIKGENFFKVRAYRKAAESIYHLDENLTVLYEQDKIGDIPGVGTGVKRKIEEMIEKGSSEYYEKLMQE